MVKSTLYTTAKVLPGNRIEIESPDLTVGQTVEVVILVEEVSSHSSTTEDISPSLKQLLALMMSTIRGNFALVSASLASKQTSVTLAIE